MEIKKVGVLGCGLMSSRIAQVSAKSGFEVTVLELEQKYIEKGFAAIGRSLDKLASKRCDCGVSGCDFLAAEGHNPEAAPRRVFHHACHVRGV